MSEKWEAKPYVKLAVQHGYTVQFVEPETPWRKDVSELAKRDSHGVPEDIIQRMLDQWEDDFTVEKHFRFQGSLGKVNL